jgi:hypothetical protein
VSFEGGLLICYLRSASQYWPRLAELRPYDEKPTRDAERRVDAFEDAHVLPR